LDKKTLSLPPAPTQEERIRIAQELEAQAQDMEEDEEDLAEILRKDKIWSKWAFIIQLLSEQALERYGTIDITDEQMAELFLEGLKEYRPTVNVSHFGK